MILKIIIIGDPSVGKTSLLRRIIDNTFNPKYNSTLGVDFSFKHLDVSGSKVKLQIWDTAGQEKYRSLITTYYKHTNGIIIVFDLSDMNSFRNILENWLKHIIAYLQDEFPKILILGNKLDIMKTRGKSDQNWVKRQLEKNGKCIMRDLEINTAMEHDESVQDIQFQVNGGRIYTLFFDFTLFKVCLLYTSPSPRDLSTSRMPSSA